MTRLVYSSDAWRLLNGIVSIYKPPGMGPKYVEKILKANLVKELNQMERKVDPRFLAGKKNILEIDASVQGGPYVPQSKLIQDNLRVPLISHRPKGILQRMSDDSYINGHDADPDMKEDVWSQEDNIYDDDYNDEVALEEEIEYSGFLEGNKPNVKEMIDYSSHPLVLGAGYSETDIVARPVNNLTTRASGVMLVGLNNSVGLARKLRFSKPLLTYEVDCEFGKHTKTGFSDSPVIAKATWKHLNSRQWYLDQICSNIEASHQRQAWATANVDPQSQEGYELACKGPIRPIMLSETIIYSIRCTKWNLPNFTLRIQCVGDDHLFLLDTVAEIGIRLKSHAHTTRLRCYQVSSFTAEDSIVPEQFSLQNVLQNISLNRKNIRKNKIFFKSNFNKVNYSTPVNQMIEASN